MNRNTLLTKLLALSATVVSLAFASSSIADRFQGYLDLRAAILVFIVPLFVLILFQKERIEWRQIYKRMRETLSVDELSLKLDLEAHTAGATGPYAHSQLMKLSAEHRDSMVRYAGELASARFSPVEVSRLLSQRIESEDLEFQRVSDAFAFMAKMAPYFGMLATVLGMTKLLEHMSDFSRISSSMALAMQGTLYGLVSFTLIYSPLLRLLSSWRDQLRRRNELVARWFVLVTGRAEGAYVREDLRSFDPRLAPQESRTEKTLANVSESAL